MKKKKFLLYSIYAFGNSDYLTLYNISRNYSWSEKYFINFIIGITYIIIITIFLRDRLEYNSLIDRMIIYLIILRILKIVLMKNH